MNSNFRRVKVQASSLQVYPGEIALSWSPRRCAWRVRRSPGFAIPATRPSMRIAAPTPASRSFSPARQVRRPGRIQPPRRVEFQLLQLRQRRFVLARNTRYGQERAFGTPGEELIPCPSGSTPAVPPRCAASPVNAAGPRDPETGYPIGGAGALINSTELRLPPPTLPWLGNTVSFVLFHDMGNVFTNASMPGPAPCGFASRTAIRARTLSRPPQQPGSPPAALSTSTGWQGNAASTTSPTRRELGLRYHTPVGPIRLDFSYNLNPPIYPVIYNYSLSQSRFRPARGRSRPLQLLLQPGTDLLMSTSTPIRPTMRPGDWRVCLALAVDGSALASAAGPAQHGAGRPQPRKPVVLDRVVAVVNNHAILASDVDDEIRLSVLDPGRAASAFSRASGPWSS
jgi:hypothetical protein